MGRITINDVAKLARVSKSTVSNVINQRDFVSEKTREKVEAAIGKLNYIPNRFAQNLGRSTSGLIGFMYPDHGSDTVLSLLRGAHAESSKNNKSIVVFETNFDIEKEKKVFELLNQGVLDGLLIVSCSTSYMIIENMNKDNNIVFFQDTKSLKVSSVIFDIQRLLLSLTPYIEEKNKSFGVIIGKHILKKYMIDSYLKVTKDNLKKYVITDCSSYEEGYQAGLKFLKSKFPPEIIWADGIENGAGLKKAYLDKGCTPPEIISMGNSSLGKYAELITIDTKTIEAGKKAYLLIGKPIEHVLIQVEFNRH